MYKSTGRQHKRPILWGGQASFYTGKARSYLIKKGVSFEERFRADPRFTAEIVPQIGYFVIPVLELEDGRLLQDTTQIILHFEQCLPSVALVPSSARQKSVAWLLGFFGSECLWKHGLHYRWSFMEEQGAFLMAEFGRSGTREKSAAGRAAAAAPAISIFASKLPDVGVTPETIPAIESTYVELLDLLEEHFFHYPYMLGGRPSIADFGLIAPMYAHLARDPVPGAVMKKRAPNVFRWTERMFQSGFSDGEFPDLDTGFIAEDALPETAIEVLRHFFNTYSDELIATIEAFNRWCDDHADVPEGKPIIADEAKASAHPSLGWISFEFKGQIHRKIATVDALLHLQYARDVIAALPDNKRTEVVEMIDELGGGALLETRMTRRIAFADYRCVTA